MWCRIRFFLILFAAAVMLAGSATGESDMPFTKDLAYWSGSDGIYSGLKYDEENNIWYTDDEQYAGLADIMKRDILRSQEIRGSYILATDDKILFIAGINSKDVNGNRVDAYTTYEIGSLTKMITATAVLQLCEKNRLSTDDKLEKYFPEFAYGRDITICHLLHMQSGLRRDFVTDDTFLSDNGEPDFEKWKRYYDDGFSDEELLGMLFDDDLEFKPGMKYAYSNTGYTLLAMIIEKVTGQSFGEYVKENIFDKCGMKHSSSMTTGDVTSIPESVPGLNDPKDLPGEIDTLYQQLSRTLRGCGDIHSCVADMLAFDRALSGGELIGEKSLAEMFNNNNKYGCGWVRFENASDTWYHGGESYFYLGYNMYMKSAEYGNLYLIQFHPIRSGDEYSHELMRDIAIAAHS